MARRRGFDDRQRTWAALDTRRWIVRRHRGSLPGYEASGWYGLIAPKETTLVSQPLKRRYGGYVSTQVGEH